MSDDVRKWIHKVHFETFGMISSPNSSDQKDGHVVVDMLAETILGLPLKAALYYSHLDYGADVRIVCFLPYRSSKLYPLPFLSWYDYISAPRKPPFLLKQAWDCVPK